MLYYTYEQTIQQHNSNRYALACGLGVSVAMLGRYDMTVKQLIEQLKQLNPDAECVFAEYTKIGNEPTRTLFWYLTICCNVEHQEKENQVWFSRNLLIQ